MNRITQRTSTDCLRCCIAMILDMDYDEVPDFVQRHGEMWARSLDEWLDGIGHGLLIIKGGAEYIPRWLPVIALDKKDNGTGHAIIVQRDHVIDPHEPPIGIQNVHRVFAILPKPPNPTSQKSNP